MESVALVMPVVVTVDAIMRVMPMRVIVIMMMRMIVRVIVDALGRPAAARVLAEQERLDGHRDGV